MSKGPVLIDLDDQARPAPDVSDAPPVPDMAPPQGEAMQIAARVAARRPSRLARWFWGLVAALLGAWISVAAWDFALSLIDRVPLLGWAVTALIGALAFVFLLIVMREAAAIGRLGKVDHLRMAADTALADADLEEARAVTRRLAAFYSGRDDVRWGR
ncbi:TIGR01620 family protein, partial [Cribrihabitans sp. XS_ASV171]